MNGSTLTVALRALNGLIATAWLGLIAVSVIVFGAGGWEVWPVGQPVCHSATEDSMITDCAYRAGTWTSTTPRAHGLPRGPALVIGCLGALALWVAVRRLRRRR